MTAKKYAILGFAAPTLFLITYVILANLHPDYSLLTKAVSELGAVNTPNNMIWNILGYIIPGVLISLFSIGLLKKGPTEASGKVPFIGIFLSGAFMALSGIFPGNFDDRRSFTMLIHTIGSFGSYLFFLLGAFTYPKRMAESVHWKSAIKPTLLCTWLTIVFGSWPFIFPNMPALGQRVVFAFYFLWIVVAAQKLYTSEDNRQA